MKGTLIVVTAIVGLAIASPALAEDIYVGSGRGGIGVGVDVGPGHRSYRERDEAYTSGYDRSRGRCETTIIRRGDGSVRKIKRCRD
jgi:hypothetical protein